MATAISVTTLCWWLYDGDRFQMLVTESLCWWLFLLCWGFIQHIKSVTNIPKLSPHFVSNIHHQHRCKQKLTLLKSLKNVDRVRLHIVRFIFLYKVWSDRIISLLFRFHFWQMNLYFEIFDERDETTSCLLFRVHKRWPTPFKTTRCSLHPLFEVFHHKTCVNSY